MDDFLSSEADDLELSFASTMSLNSPPRDTLDLAPESERDNHPDYAPMDISPAPPTRVDKQRPFMGRPRAMTSNARLFGRDMSNNSGGNGSVTSLQSVAKSTGTNGASKRLQRAALPFEWMATGGQDANVAPEPQNIPSSPAASDAMDVDSSFVYVPSSSVPSDGPLSAVPTITAFDVNNNPLAVPTSAAPTISTFEDYFTQVRACDFDGFAVPDGTSPGTPVESPSQPFSKKRRSSSPMRGSARLAHQILEQEAAMESSPAPSSPMVHKLNRMPSIQALRKPMLSGLGSPLELNANKKRPRRPALSALIAPGDGLVAGPRSANPIGEKESNVPASNLPRHVMPPVRRAFSAMLPPSMMEQSMSSEDGQSFDSSADMSSPAQAYAKRQQVKTIRRCDGTEDFRSNTGATSMVRRDSEAMVKGLRRSEVREDRATVEPTERDTPRSKYLNGLGSFGDNEAHGKILPCHRVREDGLMRITSKTMNALLDGKFDPQLTTYHIIDCRFDYEYNGGHIPGAVNINTTAGVEEFLLGASTVRPIASTSGDAGKKTILVFHCEFSVKRAPTFAKYLRSKDRALNNHVYPKIHYPEIYILEGGYSQYYQDAGARCQPSGYVRMDDPHFAQSRKEDLDQFRKGKFGRTKSYAYGDSKPVSALSQQPKRNTAPSGGPTHLFAAANAARGRRGGMGTNSALQMLAEGGSADHESDGDDTDIGDSPCPPPTKTVTYKAKKVGRLGRTETYDGVVRIPVAY
ncbi:uncharacterized protein B0H18DRAFT_872563 [Fomitopsis serialis]|uniref:uncharacterized protein n=1 Tax=Fomitopsis serialis TaxID=139415 RepID=UPI0020075693|nr:uncharacterized protein B0H18DRAFT_872563 [Neoantrodia serialis]KAH9930915.1 hypothetical protein B0H18DRAFT_872563 [Neoantrodia serialis]